MIQNTSIPTSQRAWHFVDSEELHAIDNMAMDSDALEQMNVGLLYEPILRFFEWVEPSVTFGYLLDSTQVEDWAKNYGKIPIVKRPTGGGAVFHQPADLSVSLLWPRHQNFLPENPRDCYQFIHKYLKEGLDQYKGGSNSDLFIRPPNSCEQPGIDGQGGARRFSVCFQEPVCNDVMMNGQKIIGGALRLMKKAMLYQGAIQLDTSTDKSRLKEIYIKIFPPFFNASLLSLSSS